MESRTLRAAHRRPGKVQRDAPGRSPNRARRTENGPSRLCILLPTRKIKELVETIGLGGHRHSPDRIMNANNDFPVRRAASPPRAAVGRLCNGMGRARALQSAFPETARPFQDVVPSPIRAKVSAAGLRRMIARWPAAEPPRTECNRQQRDLQRSEDRLPGIAPVGERRRKRAGTGEWLHVVSPVSAAWKHCPARSADHGRDAWLPETFSLISIPVCVRPALAVPTS